MNAAGNDEAGFVRAKAVYRDGQATDLIATRAALNLNWSPAALPGCPQFSATFRQLLLARSRLR
jgi:hypothetical protein